MARPSIFPIKKLIGFDPELWGKIQEYRFQARLNTESDAIRQLIEAGLGKAPASAPPGGSAPGSTRKPPSAGKTTAPRAKKPTASDRRASPPSSKEVQIRALREQGA
jgi:hypothetical protein